MSQVKVYKKGDWLFKEGEKLTHLTWIQSGSVNLCLIRGKKNLEIQTLGANHILGEVLFLGQSTHTTSAYCTQETKVLEVPIDLMKTSMESASQPIKVFLRSMMDRLKMASNEIKNFRLEKDSSPLPEDQVAKAFGSLYHAVKTRGVATKPGGPVEADWVSLKQYAQRIFAESPKRLEQSINLLVKLKQAELIMGKPIDNPEGPDELQAVRFHSPQFVEDFFEFFQYYYFKGGKAELLRVDDFCVQMLDLFVQCVDGLPIDKFGIVSVEFGKLTEYCKTNGLNLNNDHFSRLEQKGVYNKRTQIAGVVYVQFELKEYKKIQSNWKFLKEIEKWNEKGFVDMDEKVVKLAKKGETSCPQCLAIIANQQKFCGECGFKLLAA